MCDEQELFGARLVGSEWEKKKKKKTNKQTNKALENDLKFYFFRRQLSLLDYSCTCRSHTWPHVSDFANVSVVVYLLAPIT